MEYKTRKRSRFTRAALPAALVALVAAVWAPAAAVATEPSSGPTGGGTAVTGEVPDGVRFSAVSAGYLFSFGLGSDGRAYSWGSNGFGQLGDGTTAAHPAPAPLRQPDGVRFTEIEGGYVHAVALASDGDAYAWGDNGSGQLGDGTTTGHSTPQPVPAPAGVTFTGVSAGYSHSLALGSDGNVYAWGANDSAQLGDGTRTTRSTPVAIPAPAGKTFTAVSGGETHSLALASDGSVYAWGSNLSGKLGDGTTTDRLQPVRVSAPAGVTFTAVAAGRTHSVALASDGSVYTWGNNQYGQLGDGTTTNRPAPVEAALPSGVAAVAIAAGEYFTVALGSDGVAYAWGANQFGRLGDGTTTNRTTPVPVLVPAGATVARLAVGEAHVLAVTGGGATLSWGYNSSGQLGDGTNTTRPTPAPISDVTLDAVLFGAAPGSDLTRSGASWSVTTPAHDCGVATVQLAYTQFGRQQTVDAGAFTFGSAPVVTTQPESAALDAGGTFTATAGARGDDAPTVRWQQSDSADGPWTDVPDATATTLTATVSATTWYRAAFTNCLGTAYSAVATATVNDAGGAGGGDGGDNGDGNGGNGDGGGGNAGGTGVRTPAPAHLASTGTAVSGALWAVPIAGLALGAALIAAGRRRARKG